MNITIEVSLALGGETLWLRAKDIYFSHLNYFLNSTSWLNVTAPQIDMIVDKCEILDQHKCCFYDEYICCQSSKVVLFLICTEDV